MQNLIMICLIAGGTGAILQGLLGIGTGIVIVPLLTFILPEYGIDQTWRFTWPWQLQWLLLQQIHLVPISHYHGISN